MNDNERTIPQQIAHLEAMASTMREDLAEARGPAGEPLRPHASRSRCPRSEGLLKGVMKKVKRLRRKGQQADAVGDVADDARRLKLPDPEVVSQAVD
jgi:hypothetical protein